MTKVLPIVTIALLVSCTNGENSKNTSTKNSESVDTMKIHEEDNSNENPKTKPALTKVEVLSLTKEYIAKTKAICPDCKLEDLKIYKCNSSTDSIEDYFLCLSVFGPAENLMYKYFFYNSDQRSVSNLRISGQKEPIGQIKIRESGKPSLSADITLYEETNDIGTFERSVKCKFQITGNKIIFDSQSKEDLKFAKELLDEQLVHAYEDLESEYSGEEE